MSGWFFNRDENAENMLSENLLPVYSGNEKHSMAKLTNDGLMTPEAFLGGAGGMLTSKANAECMPAVASKAVVFLTLGICECWSVCECVNERLCQSTWKLLHILY